MPTKEEMTNFTKAIDSFVMKSGLNYIEAIVEYCKESGLEIEVAASLINSNLKSKIAAVAHDHNLMKEKVNRLPI
jgi:hypothetical protein